MLWTVQSSQKKVVLKRPSAMQAENGSSGSGAV